MRKNLLLPFALSAVALLLASSSSFGGEQKEREFKECSVCPVMIGIPGGNFIMGSPADEPGRFDAEGPQHPVAVRAFALGKFPVTSEEFLTFLKDTGYQPRPCNPLLNLRWQSPGRGYAYPPYVGEPPRWPAVCLDWDDAQAYLDWLNKKAREEHPATAGSAAAYRLPSEAEWEYAARGGTTTARWWGETIGAGNANCNGCGSKFDYRLLADVDSFAPNPFGLYGVLGNAWEWTQDCWHESYVGAPGDGSPWTVPFCNRHVIRGGSWDNLPVFIRSAARAGSIPNGGEYDYSSLSGLRIARTLP